MGVDNMPVNQIPVNQMPMGNSERMPLAELPCPNPDTLEAGQMSREEETRVSLGQEIMRIQRQSQLMRRAQQMAQQQRLAQESFNGLPLEETVNTSHGSSASCGPLEDSMGLLPEDASPIPPPSYNASMSSSYKRTVLQTSNVRENQKAVENSVVLERNSVNTTGSRNEEVPTKDRARRKALAQAAGAAQDARVLEFLDKMRNDKKFQVTLTGSAAGNLTGNKESTMNLELSDEPSALTESKFRQGLEASLDLPTTDND